ncbi:choline dehydrogenase, partial [Apiospora kogelbergensis]
MRHYTLLALCAISPAWAAPSTSRSFDYVVVGGGTAGLTVANRLSEDAHVTVAVVEAGNAIENGVGNLSYVPGYVSMLQASIPGSASVGWGFKTTPQQLGGCSTINNMAYGRTSKGALQRLAETVGDQSYTWNQVLPFYQKSMNFAPPDDRTRLSNATPSYDPKAVARGGPLSVNFPAYAESWSTWVVKGLAAIGISPGRALVEGALSGSTWQLMTVDHATGRRSSSNSAFLSPVSRRNNLVVFTDTMAEQTRWPTLMTMPGGALTNPGGDLVGLEKIPSDLRANWSPETKSALSALPDDWPEIQYLVFPAAFTPGTQAGASYASLIPALQAPQSTGNVTISSARMSDPPVINPNWLTAQADLDVLVAGFKRMRQLVASKAMAGVTVGEEFLPGPSVQTDDQILAFVKAAGQSMCHAHATNAMGKASDANAVVDSSGKVYGVKNPRQMCMIMEMTDSVSFDVKVRVVDASAFPFLLP